MKVFFLGRFQPLHKGHHKVIEKNKDKYDSFKILVGSAEKSDTEENPLNFKERQEIISNCFPDLELIALKDEDDPENGNDNWRDKIIEKYDPDLIISGNPLVNEIFEETDVDVKKPDFYDKNVYSGTEIRRRIRSGEAWTYLIPKCAKSGIKKHIDVIKDSGIQYEYEPGWKKENSFYGTEDSNI